MRFPEIRVTRAGPRVTGVEWDPQLDGEPAVSFMEMRVLKVERDVTPGDAPVVKVSFMARLVEIEEDNAPA